MTLTIQSTGDIYTFRKVRASDRTWWEALDWDYPIYKPGVTAQNISDLFAKKFMRAICSFLPNSPGEGGYSFQIVELNNNIAAVIAADYSTRPDATNNALDVRNLSLCVDPAYRGQGRMKHLLGMLAVFGARVSGEILDIKYTIRHSAPALRALVTKRNADSTDTEFSVSSRYNSIISDTIYDISLSSTYGVDPRYTTSDYVYSDLQLTNVPINDPKWAIPEVSSIASAESSFTDGLII
jgi:GNAT superfamily N-acetyltransferase